MKNKPLILITILIALFCLCVGYWYSRGYKNSGSGTISESDAIETIKNQFPELKEYPSDKLAPKSIETQKTENGWHVAFVQEGSGVPIILARCYFIDNTKEITSTGVYSPKYSEYGINDISITNCRPKDPNPKPGGEVPPIPGNIVGGDKDEHGCIGSAGYSWCQEKQKCLRVWEETCGGNSGSSNCALENCHGLDIKCGSNPPDVCTEIYMVGDKCLRYAKCGVQNGECQQIEDPQFTQCKLCTQKCVDANKNDNVKLFECESNCN